MRTEIANDNTSAKVGAVGQLTLKSIKTEDGRQTMLQNAPIMVAFGIEVPHRQRPSQPFSFSVAPSVAPPKAATKEMRCSVREIHGPALHPAESLFGLEMRIERNGEMYLTELYKDPAKLQNRCTELHQLLIAKGWHSAV